MGVPLLLLPPLLLAMHQAALQVPSNCLGPLIQTISLAHRPLPSSPSLPQEGIVAILTSSPTDVLSHIAIRARAQGVLLATCFDAEGGWGGGGGGRRVPRVQRGGRGRGQ